MALSILYVGSPEGTSLQRARALEALGHRVQQIASGFSRTSLRHQLYRVGHHLGHPPDLHRANTAIRRAVRAERFDVLWVDKGRSIRPGTLRLVRRIGPGICIVSYSPDDMMDPSHSSRRYRACVPLYNLHVTTKSYNVPELTELGATRVLYVHEGFDPELHRPLDLSPADRARYACDVGFVGYFEDDRARAILELACAGVPVTIWGPAWRRFRARNPRLVAHDGYLDGLEYAKAINATRINLGFLRKSSARDRHTTRSVEIPACGGFMLAERTEEHQSMFQEGKEAEYFGSTAELIEKCRYYLAHEAERARIAAAGRRRCVESGYSHADRMRTVIEFLEREVRPSRTG